VKKLLALAIVGGFLVLMTGCPPATTKTSTGPAPMPTGPKDKPVTDKPVTDKPVTDKPVTDKPVTDKPVTDKPVTDKPVTDKPVTDKPVIDKSKPHEGTFVSAADNMLTMTGKDGKKMEHKLSKTATITVDDKPAKVEDLKADMKITVTTDDKGDVTKIEAKK
jgi:hypothetical protein